MFAVEERLRQRGVPFSRLAHGRTYAAVDEAHAVHATPSEVVKTIAIKSRSGPVVAAIPASRRLDMDAVRFVLDDADARLETETEMEGDFPGCDLGALPPIGSLLHVPVYLDPEVMSHSTVVIPTCQTESVRVETTRLFEGEVGTIAHLTRLPPA